MSLEQANRYYALAAKARQNGRNAIAEALLRQAEREKEKEPIDIRDVANIQRDNQNAIQNVAQPQQNIAQPQESVVQNTPAVDQSQLGGGEAIPPAYQPSAEELANMADSEQYNANNSTVGDLYNQNYTDLGVNTTYTPVQRPTSGSSSDYPNMDNTGDVIASAPQLQEPNHYGAGASFDVGSPKIYDPDTFAGAPPEGDEVWNTPEEQNARMLANKKKQKEIEELARQAEAAQIGAQYWGNNRVY